MSDDSGNDDDVESALLVVTGMLGFIICTLLGCVWSVLEKQISETLKMMQDNRRERELFIRLSRRSLLRDAAEEERPQPQRQSRVTSSPLSASVGRGDAPPSYREVVTKEERKKVDSFQNLPNYKEAVANIERGIALEVAEPPPEYSKN